MSLKILSISLLLLQINLAFSLNCSDFNPKKIKLITFDVYGALMNTMDSLYQQARLLVPHAIPDNKVNQIIDCWMDHYAEAKHVDAKKFNDPFDDFLRIGIVQCLSKFNLDWLLTKEKIDAFMNIWTKLKPWNVTVATLEKLTSKGIKIGIMSNGSTNSLSQLIKNSMPSVNFSYIFASTVPKAFKPNVAVYKQVESTGFAMEEMLHVAGAQFDVNGARSYGVFAGLNKHEQANVEHFKMFSSYFADGSNADIPACFVLKDLSDLLEIMKVDQHLRYLS